MGHEQARYSLFERWHRTPDGRSRAHEQEQTIGALAQRLELDYFQCRIGNPATGDWKVGSVLIASEPR
jgi:hypothetical protein